MKHRMSEGRTLADNLDVDGVDAAGNKDEPGDDEDKDLGENEDEVKMMDGEVTITQRIFVSIDLVLFCSVLFCFVLFCFVVSFSSFLVDVCC